MIDDTKTILVPWLCAEHPKAIDAYFDAKTAEWKTYAAQLMAGHRALKTRWAGLGAVPYLSGHVAEYILRISSSPFTVHFMPLSVVEFGNDIAGLANDIAMARIAKAQSIAPAELRSKHAAARQAWDIASERICQLADEYLQNIGLAVQREKKDVASDAFSLAFSARIAREKAISLKR